MLLDENGLRSISHCRGITICLRLAILSSQATRHVLIHGVHLCFYVGDPTLEQVVNELI